MAKEQGFLVDAVLSGWENLVLFKTGISKTSDPLTLTLKFPAISYSSKVDIHLPLKVLGKMAEGIAVLQAR